MATPLDYEQRYIVIVFRTTDVPNETFQNYGYLDILEKFGNFAQFSNNVVPCTGVGTWVVHAVCVSCVY